MNEYYEKTFLIDSTEVDTYGFCTPSVLLRFLQDIVTEHSTILKVDRDYLVEQYHAVWLLVRAWYRLDRPLQAEEELTIRTWHRGAGGMIIYRDFDFFAGGKLVGEAVTAWVVADLDTRKMLRPRSISNMAAAAVPNVVKDKQLKLIRTPLDRKFIYTKTVRYSDLDINGHMNNTKYADVMLDALSVEDLEGRFISELQLNFSMECKAGETMDISRSMAENACYVDGRSPDGTRRFESFFKFQPVSAGGVDEDGSFA